MNIAPNLVILHVKNHFLIFRMAAIKNLNPKAEIARNHQALAINISAARGLRDVMKTNLGPKVTDPYL